MRQRTCFGTVELLLAAVVLGAWAARPVLAQDQTQTQDQGSIGQSYSDEIKKFSIEPDADSVYAPPGPPREDQGINAGGAHFDLTVTYMTAYIYRGVDYNKVAGKSDSRNEQFDARLEFDLGRLPHPFIGVFANIYDADPVSRFQEFRPYFGLELELRPLTITVGHTSYIYPEREQFNTDEVFAKLSIDDSYLLGTKHPIFSPYVFGAYDYDLNHGFYVEAGLRHEFDIEETPLKLIFIADVGYISGISQQFVFTNLKDSGFQHYDVGMIASYSLNQFFKISDRFGIFSLNGYLYYTGGIEREDFHTTDQLWGGVGIAYHY